MEYEPVQPFFLCALARRADCRTFLDVGSNVGLYALFATLIPSIRHIVAFEANSDTARELRANLALNELGNRVEIDGRAVSDAPGTLTFGIVSKFSGANSVVDTSIHDRAAFRKQVSVEAITLDQLFGEQSGLDPLCLKIDVEGHEGQVIDGARATLRNHRAVIQLEGYEQVAVCEGKLNDIGYSHLTHVGPDHYFTNVESLLDPATVVSVYEEAIAQLVAYNHRNKAILLKRGDFALQLTGKSADIARNLAKRWIGRRL